jgi:PAS domain S-box-containing protein
MRILIADDDHVCRLSLVGSLKRWGYDPVVTCDGEEAWTALQGDEAPRLALLDVMMPGMDGLAVCRKVRERAGEQPTYIILVTAKTFPEDIVQGLQAGADDYVSKPFEREELRARLQVGERILSLQQKLVAQVHELHASQARLRGIVESAQDGILTTERDGTIRDFNPAAERMFGWSRDEAVGQPFAKLLATERLGWNEPGPAAIALPGRHRDGQEFPLELTIAVIRAEGGELFSALIRDVSERKRLEVELHHAQKLEAVGRLAAGIAHEINTPIQFVGDNTRFLGESFASLMALVERYQGLHRAALAGSVEPALLREIAEAEAAADVPYLADDVPKAVSQTLDGVNRVATIVRAMKEFAHPGAAQEKTAADLNQALLSTLTVARNELKYVADVETELGDLPPVPCHLGDVNQVFLNLLVNAAHAIAEVVGGSGTKGCIRVRTVREADAALVTISDTGCGIPDAIRTKIFDPFFTTKEVGRGTGQGLAIARSVIVDKHGGSLRFESEVGKGTTFLIRLPLASPTSDPESQAA